MMTTQMPNRVPEIRTVAMPADANPDGDIFGGWIMSNMDTASGVLAARAAKGRVVTVAVDAMTFHKPVFVGDDVSFFCHQVKHGNTSMAIHVDVWAVRRHSDDVAKVTEGVFTFVAIDSDGRPRSLA